jgi:hypothetical protein
LLPRTDSLSYSNKKLRDREVAPTGYNLGGLVGAAFLPRIDSSSYSNKSFATGRSLPQDTTSAFSGSGIPAASHSPNYEKRGLAPPPGESW